MIAFFGLLKKKVYGCTDTECICPFEECKKTQTPAMIESVG